MNQTEIGGDFHWISHFPAPFEPWPDNTHWFSRGRDTALLVYQQTGADHLFVPSFFCDEVIAAWRASGIVIKRYLDHPERPQPDFTQASPDANDLVLVVNYFGASDKRAWAKDIYQSFGAKVIEDHTHDPCSDWARQSHAAYAMASLRKTLPVTDGALLWSPTAEALQDLPSKPHYSDTRLAAAMALKSTFLESGQDPDLKQAFRTMQLEGHQDLERDKNILGISAWSQSQLMPGFPKSWRIQRQSNVASLAQNLKALGCHPDTVCGWTHDQTPMAYVLKLADASQRDRVRQHLIQHQIFPPIHWLSQDTPDPDAKELGNRVLSIPIDQRYQASDMSRVAEVLRSALHN